ncbi:MAG: ornithine carbamoyltransferase [Candidatus Omnitrophica bacterium]|nr:ornithine carbamoyltransferase [Candidatus Omnitrophota bacterium]MDD5429568.1 ornithine carbamoyltransferase [Candidatus Omnitrophota bacterium]
MDNFIALKNFSAEQINDLVELALKIKRSPADYQTALKGKYAGLLFEKPSLRTKTAFYVGSLQLGAQPVYYAPQEIKLGQREEVKDAARTFSKYLDVVVLRTSSHAILEEFSKFSSIPVVNALSDLLHPSQAIADILTIRELKKDIRKIKVAYAGDGNNVCNSLIYAFSILGGNLNLAIPARYKPRETVLKEALAKSASSGAHIEFVPSLKEAVCGADIIYTDVWTSMGKESERKIRKKYFKSFQINDTILKLAKNDVAVMHCLPAHRGEEITDSVIDGDNSVVFLQAENRLHAAKAILFSLLKK